MFIIKFLLSINSLVKVYLLKVNAPESKTSIKLLKELGRFKRACKAYLNIAYYVLVFEFDNNMHIEQAT